MTPDEMLAEAKALITEIEDAAEQAEHGLRDDDGHLRVAVAQLDALAHDLRALVTAVAAPAEAPAELDPEPAAEPELNADADTDAPKATPRRRAPKKA